MTASKWAEIVDDLADTTSGLPEPLHSAEDAAKVMRLADDMAANGWQGAPLVVDGEQAITGSHRIAALAALVNGQGIEVHAPRVQISDVFAAAGLDWSAHLAEHGADAGYWQWYEAAAAAGHVLPAELVEYLGLDAH